ncbi:MAG TPA: DUF4266 domain-containing protein [Casimicrobiaceae bacterium]|nr:DUF4266 domain-containing protein [Casimicrobiaceae bacterium]
MTPSTATNAVRAHAGRLRCAYRAMLAAIAVASMVAGCATFDPPKPWEKGDLARPSMRFDADPLAARATAHVYQSKEGAAGGGTVGGGGCGCN